MATKIRRCLFIGLGGTGMDTLLHTKKMFMETYGEVPPMIGFLGIDTNNQQYNVELDSHIVGKIKLDPNEQLALPVNNALATYNTNKTHFTWLPDENVQALAPLNNTGAGQIRTNGRFCLTVNYQSVINKITNTINSISNAQIINNDKYELLSPHVEIHMVFSICGGTGAGTFLNTAYLVKEAAPNCKLACYAVLPDVFRAMSSNTMNNVKANAYCAINCLDFLRHQYGVKPITFDYIQRTITHNQFPIDAFTLIDNKDRKGNVYNHVSQLSEMISLALMTSTGELSTATKGTMDNIVQEIQNGNFNIQNKQAWIAGMGVSKITYSGHRLSQIYSKKIGQRIISLLLNSCNNNISAIVNAWIDSPNVNIRENNGFDNVIDAILSKEPNYTFDTINDNQQADIEANNYIFSQLPKSTLIDKQVNVLTQRINRELPLLIKKHINNECGIADAEQIVLEIQNQVNLFMGEMKSELANFENKQPQYAAALKATIAELKEYDAKFFNTSSGKKERQQDVFNAAMQLVICQREKIRRQAAIRFYNNVTAKLLDESMRITRIKDNILSIHRGFTDKITRLQNNVGQDVKMFEIDLSIEKSRNICIDDNDIDMNKFIGTITFSDKIYNLDDLSLVGQFEKCVIDYASNLSKAKDLKNASIEQELKNWNDNALSQLINKALEKSNPLLCYDDRGYGVVGQPPTEVYYIGVPDKDNSVLKKNDKLKNLIPGNPDVDFASIGINDTIIIYRQLTIIPAFFIERYPTYEADYIIQQSKSNKFFHIDTKLVREMRDTNFSIYPAKQADNTEELWVNGFIFGFIKNENEMYYYLDEENGDPLDEYWMPLKRYRDEAFVDFKRVKYTIEEQFNRKISDYEKTHGKAKVDELREDVRQNYWKKYSQLNMEPADVKQYGYEGIADRMREEIKFVRNL